MKILCLLPLILLSCSENKSKSLLEHIDDNSSKIILFVPDPYCGGCLTRSLYLLRKYTNSNNYLFVSTKSINNWIENGENFEIIPKANYITSTEYDYHIYIWIRNKSTIWKQKLATEEDFSNLKIKLDSIALADLSK